MIRSPKSTDVEERQVLRLSGVDWATYEEILRIFEQFPGHRLAYDNGELEIMAPSYLHDSDSAFFGLLVAAMADEFGLNLRPGRGTTFKKERMLKGVEADECFWISNAAKVAGKKNIDLAVDPPPDLAIEVDVSRSSLDRVRLYQRIGVPELWRFADDQLTIYIRDTAGKYATSDISKVFAPITANEICGFVLQARNPVSVLQVIREVRTWVRGKIRTTKE